MMKLIKTITIIGIFGLLTACGGGGGGSTGAIVNPGGGGSPVTFNSSFSEYVSAVNTVISSSSTSAIVDASPNDVNEARAFIDEFEEVKSVWDLAHINASTRTKLSWYADEEYRNARKIINWLENEVLPIARDFADDGKFEDSNIIALENKIIIILT